MISFLLLVPVILSFLSLAAHFLHSGSLLLTGLCLAVPWLLLIPRAWVMRLIQVLLLVGAFVWLMEILSLIQEYQQDDRPWHRMVIIMGSVLVFTAASGLVFAAPRLRRRYAAPMPAPPAEAGGPASEQEQGP